MPYYGNRFVPENVRFLSFGEVYIIIVSGEFPNLCAHTLINFGGEKGFYVHVVPEENNSDYLRYMNHSEYQRYLKATTKTELQRKRLHVTSPIKSMNRLAQLAEHKWDYDLLRHNCMHFVDEVATAGGAVLWGICPSLSIQWIGLGR